MANKFTLAKVLVDLPIKELSKFYVYEIPPHLRSKINIGSLVKIPFSHGLQLGFVVGFTNKKPVKKIKKIQVILEEKPQFSPVMFELCRWMSNYYLAPLSNCIKHIIKPGGAGAIITLVKLTQSKKRCFDKLSKKAFLQRKIVEIISNKGKPVKITRLQKLLSRKNLFNSVISLEKRGLIKRIYSVKHEPISYRFKEIVKLKISQSEVKATLKQLENAPKQKEILKKLSLKVEIEQNELLKSTKSSHSSISSLEKKGYIEIVSERVKRKFPTSYSDESLIPKKLTSYQKKAIKYVVDQIKKGKSATFLLQGVSGSGKTEVYLRVISFILSIGKTALVLVPEIALTPQMVTRFKNRLGDVVGVFHSKMSKGERFDQWMDINENRCQVVIGTRSAIFSPLKNLGVIIIDEEHENSYKETTSPQYNVREVAQKLAKLQNSVVILGSATPCIETRYKAEIGEYNFLTLPERVTEGGLPEVEVVDMRNEPIVPGVLGMSNTLIYEIEKTLNNKEGVILFINRRGFATFLLCTSCGYVFKCPNCDLSLKYHRANLSLICHHCNYTTGATDVCPNCKGIALKPMGMGTQRIEEQLYRLFSKVDIYRMDTDSTIGKISHQTILNQFSQSSGSILLGTQMIAKGLDIKNVILVGVVNADTALNLPDFRAAERTFQLVTQVSGRSGRGKKVGKVIIQTHFPEHYAIDCATKGDYLTFYKKEIKFRKELMYSPYSYLINILISGKFEDDVINLSNEILSFIKSKEIDNYATILGPAPAPLSRIKNKYRWHIFIKTEKPDKTKEILTQTMLEIPRLGKKAKYVVDVDPISTM
ncbi:MAG: primosomal protein N' [Actinobacteria bacterium]|nr:primosomal protein N' [Actinomycetota bacterium]